MNEDAPFRETPVRAIPHYHGDAVRIVFVLSAALMFLGEMIGGSLPFSTGATVFLIILLVVSAGITNPAQIWIHWVNLVLSMLGIVVFGGTTLTRFRADAPLNESLIVSILAVMFLAALYLSTRTVRGLLVHERTLP